jgi:AcrR family transcriptional regulator
VASHARERPKLTAKGERARARIVAAPARLIHQRGAAGATLEDVKAAADVSGSQLCRYLPDKDDLVRAVVGGDGRE